MGTKLNQPIYNLYKNKTIHLKQNIHKREATATKSYKPIFKKSQFELKPKKRKSKVNFFIIFFLTE